MIPPAATVRPGPKVWAAFGLPPSPDVRDQILVMTIIRVGHLGPTNFSAKALAAELGITPATINYHFHSREELLAEAAVRGYANYVETVWQAVRAARRDPEKRLRAWLETSIDVQVAMHGWGPILNYPAAALDVTEVLEKKHRATMTDHSELHFARLITLVHDVRRGEVADVEYELGDLPRARLLKSPKVLLAVASIGWSVLGFAVWRSGRHVPTRSIKEMISLEAKARRTHIDLLVRVARGEV